MRRSHWPKRGTTQSQAGFRLGFRSGLEATTAEQLKKAGEPVLFETFRIPYAIPMKLHHYTPDFRLRNQIIVEDKGLFLPADRAKHLFVKVQYPDLDIRFVFSNSKARLTPAGPTTYGDWCAKHGFLYADKSIPPSWLTEAGPGVSIEEVLAKGPRGFEEIIQSPTAKRKKKAP